MYLQKAGDALSTETAKAELENLNMRYLYYSRGQLRECLFEMFDRLGLLTRFQIEGDKLRAFFRDIERNYKRVPYHHFTHAFNITHVTYYVLRNSKVQEYLEEVDVLAAMLAALGHDIDHPGANNMYFQKTGHILAQTSNDASVLESYHSYMLFKLLGKPENDFLGNLTPAERQRFRKAIIETIMGTDMTKHFNLCTAFQAVIAKIKAGTFDKGSADDRDVRYSTL
jgi:hypothetical protein